MKTTVLVRTVLALFFLSGSCGLIYQSLWPQYLKLLLGHSAYAQSIVLIVFIGGLAVGAWLAGKFAAKIKAPLVAYAVCEALIGFMAIGFHYVYVPLSDWAYQSFLPSVCSAHGWCAAQWLLAGLMITPQSILLGATFPFLTAGLLRYVGARSGWLFSAAYGVNTLGAVLGVLLSSFVLLPLAGLPGTMLLAGGANILVAMIVYAIDKEFSHSERHIENNILLAQDSDGKATVGVVSSWILCGVAAFTGLSSFIYEIVWIRMLSLVLGSATHTFEIVLAGYLFGLGCGGYWIKARVDKISNAVVFLAKVQLAMGALAALTIVFYHSGFNLMAWVIAGLQASQEGYALYLSASAVLTLLFVFPTTFCAGMTLPLITHVLYKTRLGEGAIGITYAVNTVGSILGILFAVHVGMPFLGLKLSLGFAALIDVLIGLVLLWGLRGPLSLSALRNAPVWSYAILVCVFAIAVFVQFDPLYMSSGVFRAGVARFNPNSTKVLFSEDGKTATVSVVQLEHGIVSIRTNGKPDASISMSPGRGSSEDEYTMALAGFVGPMYAPRAKDVAVVGFGSGMTTSVLLSFPSIRSVDTVEIEPKMVEGARHFLPVVEAAYNDPRSNIVIDDAKSYFARNGKKYDIIVTEPSNPWVSGVASLFTEEFYARTSRSLNDGGVFVQWIQLYEFDTELLSSIVSAMKKVFPYYEVYTDSTNVVLVSSKKPLASPDYSVLYEKSVDTWFKRLGVKQGAYWQNRVSSGQIMDYFLAAVRVPANSDYYPFVDQHAPMARFKRSSVNWVDSARYMPVPLIRWLEKSESKENHVAALASHFVPSSLTYPDLIKGADERLLNQDVLRALKFMSSASAACEHSGLADSVIRSMVQVGATLHTIESGHAESFWRTYSLPDCKPLRDEGAFTWKELLDAVASDDLNSVVKHAEILRSSARSRGRIETEFLAVAHVGALAALGRPLDAVATMKSYRGGLGPGVMEKPWAVLLRMKLAHDLSTKPRELRAN